MQAGIVNSNLAGNLYYLLELATFVAVLFWQGKNQKTSGAEKAAANLAAAQMATITAQAERIALLEKENADQAEKLEKYEQRIDYLEEVLSIHGNPKVVQPGSHARP